VDGNQEIPGHPKHPPPATCLAFSLLEEVETREMLVIRRVKSGQEKRRSSVNRRYFKQQPTVSGNVQFFFLLLLATIHILWESKFHEIHVFQTHYLRFLISQ
jgi:hypothetical protein